MADFNLKVTALDKLLEFIASGIGAISGPILARWRAHAAADAARIEAEGQADALRIKAAAQGDTMSLITRAQAEAKSSLSIEGQVVQGEMKISKELESRIAFQEQKRQINIRSVVDLAADELSDKQVKNHEVDHDWVARFFADVQDVTSRYMQKIWAKILAGEVETPGRTSLLTLSILKNMTQRQAMLFEDISKFVLDKWIFQEGRYTNDFLGFPSWENMLELDSLGLLSAVPGMWYEFEATSEDGVFLSDNGSYRVLGYAGCQSPTIPITPLSLQGVELYNLSSSSMDARFLPVIAKYLYDHGNFKLEQALPKNIMDSDEKCESWIAIEPYS